MKHLSAVRTLLKYQRTCTDGLEGILNFIAQDTLQEFSVTRLFLTVKKNDGTLEVPYIENRETFPQQDEHPFILDEHAPVYESIVNGGIVAMGDVNEYPYYNLQNVPIMFPDGFKSSFIFPVPNIGAISIFCLAELTLEDMDTDFLFSIGEVLSLYLAQGNHELTFEGATEPGPVFKRLPLTPRQWAIKEAMVRGLTNGAIAREMNFSESLIRHETIRIYSKLGIKGRRELFTLDSESENNIEQLEA